MSAHQPPSWWVELQQLPQEMTREQYEADAIAEANALRPDEQPAEDLG